MNKILKFSALCLIMLQSQIAFGSINDDHKEKWLRKLSEQNPNLISIVQPPIHLWKDICCDGTPIEVRKDVMFTQNISIEYMITINNINTCRLTYNTDSNGCLISQKATMLISDAPVVSEIKKNRTQPNIKYFSRTATPQEIITAKNKAYSIGVIFPEGYQI